MQKPSETYFKSGKFGKELKSLRKRKGLTQLQVAEHLGVTKQIITYYEKGGVIPSATNFYKLQKLFDDADVKTSNDASIKTQSNAK